MELQFSRTNGMLIVFLVTISAVLTEFYSSTDNTTRPPKHVLKPRNDRNTMLNLNSEEGPGKWIYPESGINTKKTTKSQTGSNMGTDNSIKDRNTMQKSNSEEKVKWKYPESGINVKTTTAGTNMGKEFSTTDNSIKDTKNEQENLSYSTVPTKDSTPLSHHQDNSELIGIIVGLTVFLLVVVGLVCLCHHKKFLCFKRNEKRDLGISSSPILDEEKIQTQDMTVNGDVILMMVDTPMLNEKNKTRDVGDEVTVDIKTEDERYPVRTKDKPIIKSLKSLNSIQPSDASE